MQFVDKCVIQFNAGDGGDGIVAWRREAHNPEGGPWGGDGGKGGDIIIFANHNENSLFKLRYSKKISAENGNNGGSKLCHGANGKNSIISLPVGSVIRNLETNEIIFDFITPGEHFTICKGGKGGHGNAFFKSSRNKAPKLFERGDKGQVVKVLIELKYIADVGLLGLPNAGKSTFIKNISSANPKIAPYKFTTLVPVLASVEINDQKIVFADIPGLIEGASEGHGLGHEFLKHIERCHILIHLISLSNIDNEMDGSNIINSYEIIIKEIEQYNKILLNKKIFLVANKSDSEGSKENFEKLKDFIKDKKIFLISAINNDFGKLLNDIYEEFKELQDELNKNLVDPFNQYKIIKETKQEEDKIFFEKNGTGRWVVRSKKIDYWFNKIPQTTEDNWIRLSQKIEIDKIEFFLKENGAKEGDIMIINDVEYILD